MKNIFTRSLPEFILILCIGCGIFYANSDHWEATVRTSQKNAFERFLSEHPYSLREKRTPEEWKKLPKKDRPDLAWEQNFLMTLDPSTGTPAEERLMIPLAQVEEFVNDDSRYAPGDANFPWVERGPDNVGGRTRAILWDPNNDNRVFAGGVDGGLWYNDDITNAGLTWQKINDFWDNIAISCIVADPTDSDTWYVGTGEGWGNLDAVRGLGIWKTEDGGETWDHLLSTANDNFRYTQKILVDPNNGDVYAGTNTGLRRSTNGGSSWSLVLSNGNGANGNFIDDLEIGADDSFWAAVDGDGVYRSVTGNSGSWTKLNTGNGFPSFGFNRIEISTAPSDANTAYAVVVSGSSLDEIYRTTNQGGTWTTVSKPNDADTGIPADDFTRNQGWYDLISAVDPNDADHLYVGGINIFHSFNGGDSWSQISHWYGGFGEPYVHADQHGILFKPGNSNQIIFSHDGGITYSANASATQPTVSDRNNGYNVTQFYACAIHPQNDLNVYLAGSQDNGTQRFTQAGMNSTTEVTGGDGMFCHIDQTNPAYQLTSYVYNNYYRSTNGGASFSGISGGENTGRFVNPTDYDNNQDVLFAARDGSTLRRITNFTGSPTVGNMSVPIIGSTASHIRVSPYTTSSSTIFVGTGAGKIIRMTNAQAAPSSTDIDSDSELPNGYISCIELGENEDEILVTFSNYGVNSVWYTEDGGQNWESKEGDLPDMPVRWALFNPDDRDEVILATEVGVWSTANFSSASPNWVPSNSGLANVRVDMLQLRESDNQVIAATHGRGLFSGYFFTPDFPVDAGILSIDNPNGEVCEPAVSPVVTLKNFGSDPLTQVDIDYSLDGSSAGSISWTGNLLPGETESITLEEITFIPGDHTFTATTSNPNGTTDGDELNDSLTSTFTYGNNTITVQIVTDRYGAETTWEIVNESGEIVAEGGPYENQSSNGEYPVPDETVCLLNGCYDFNIYDSYGDGMCCTYGNGSYTLLDSEGTVLISGGSGWNNSESTEFCVDSPLSDADYDTGISAISAIDEEVCGESIFPSVDIENFGQVTITSATITYGIEGESLLTYDWTGSLATGESETISLPEIPIPASGSYTFSAYTEMPNGLADEYPANDESSFTFESIAGDEITLTLTTDCWGGEVSWEIQDDLGNVLFSADQGSLGNLNTYVTTACLEYGCYVFAINDSYGDGMNGTAFGCSQDGNYTITDSEGNVLVQMGDPDYGNGTTHNFCIEEEEIIGCTNAFACNYNPDADVDDGSCLLPGDDCDDGDPLTVADDYNSDCECEGTIIYGCIDENACNYNQFATVDDGSCLFVGDSCDDGNPDTIDDQINADCDCEGEPFPGCTNEAACNYDPNATVDNGTCILIGDTCDDGDPTTANDVINENCVCEGETIPGCTNEAACNYDPNATVDDGSCLLIGDTCDDSDPTTANDVINENCICEGETIPGCTNEAACNYDPNATVDDGSCILIGDTCDDGDSTTANDVINENCICEGETIPGCTNEAACNYDPNATVDDGSCILIGDTCDDGDPTTANDVINENCVCEGETIPGCTNEAACNYDPNATVDDGSCVLIGDTCDDGDPTTANDVINENCICEGETIPGCTNEAACNYDPNATVDNGTCILIGDTCDDGDPTTANDVINENCVCEGETIPGCTNEAACNYDPNATVDDGSCLIEGESCDDGDATTVNDQIDENCECNGVTIPGCTDPEACNYNSSATADDGSCTFPGDSCDDGDETTANDQLDENCDCIGEVIEGCAISIACNYDPEATVDDGSCIFPGDECDDGDPTTGNDTVTDNCGCEGEVIPGCIDESACNYNEEATVDDGSCDFSCVGCTDPEACNFDPDATIDSGTCEFAATLYLDADGDGYGDPDESIVSCDAEGYVLDNTDCDDTNPEVYPGAPGTAEGIDNNCSGELEAGEFAPCLADFDNNGYISSADLLIFLADYGCMVNCPTDLNGSGTVTSDDLLIMLSVFGSYCDE